MDSPLSIDTIWSLVSGQGGIVFFLLVILYSGSKKVWVWGHIAEEERKRTSEAKKDSEEWKDRFLEAMGQANKATDLLHKSAIKPTTVPDSDA